MSDHQKHETLPFETFFDSSWYDFWFPRYHRAKERVIFNYLLLLFLSFTRISRSHFVSLTYPKLQTSDRRDSWKNVVRISKKKCRSLGYGPIHNFCILLMETLSLRISATDWDIEMNQKVISMAWFSLCFEWILMTKFLLIFFTWKIEILPPI